MFNEFTELNYHIQILIAVTLIYGVALWVGNTINKVIGVFSGRGVLQSNLGKILDSCFYVSILYLILYFTR